MGKRSDFKRRPMDDYPTVDPNAVAPLIPHLHGVTTFAEPCAGDGHLVNHLEWHGLVCIYESDIKNGVDALTLTASDFMGADAIITNPPWTREILHRMIERFQSFAPTWLLFDADWCQTGQSAPYMDQCSHIVAVGRVKWIEGSKNTGKDNCSWYRFHSQHSGGPRFYGRSQKEAA